MSHTPPRHDRYSDAPRSNSEPSSDWQRVVDYGDRFGNRTVLKRLGYLAETYGLGDETLLARCQERVSAGIGRLDPTRPAGGPTTSRWGLQLNTRIAS